MVPEPEPNQPPLPAASPEAVSGSRKFAGKYRLGIWCHTCSAKEDPYRSDVDVTVNDDGSLQIWDSRWIEVSPLYFRSSDGRRSLGFHEAPNGKITVLTRGSFMVWERLPDVSP